MHLTYYAISLFSGYLIGSIPFGLILTRLAGLGDVRTIGSGNIGATNVLRTGNKTIAALTLLLDMLKGTFIVTILGIIEPTAAYVAGLAVVLGHVFPLWLKFKGGKGVATCFGVILVLSPTTALVSLIAWILTAYFTRYSSLAALVSISLLPITSLLLGDLPLAALSFILAILNVYTHRENIKRLRAKTEPKVGEK